MRGHRVFSAVVLFNLIVVGGLLAACGSSDKTLPPITVAPPGMVLPTTSEPVATSTVTKTIPTTTPTTTPTVAGVVYFFFSTECEYCAAQAPEMEKFHRENPDAQVVGVPLYADQQAAQEFASRYGLTFEVREDKNLVNVLGAVSQHPVIAFQSASGGPLIRASNGVISPEALTDAFRDFVASGNVTTTTGSG
jgi:peroxiredoxin